MKNTIHTSGFLRAIPLLLAVALPASSASLSAYILTAWLPAGSNPSQNQNWSNANNWFYNHQQFVPNGSSYDVDLSKANTVNMDLSMATVHDIGLASASLNVLAGNTLSATGDITVTNPAASVYVGDGATLQVGDHSHSNIFLQSDQRLSQLQFGFSGINYGNIYLDAITANSLDRLSGINGNETIHNAGLIAGAGHILGLAELSNEGTITGGGISQPLLYIQADNFLNNGTVSAVADGAVRIESNFLNLTGGGTTLSGGTYDIAGKLLINANLSTVDTSTTVILRGNGFISTLGGSSNALYNLSSNNGALQILDNGNQQFGSPLLTNGGGIVVDGNSVVRSGAIYNRGSITLGTSSSGTLYAAGFTNDSASGSLNVNSGTADFRTGGLDTFGNLSASDETLRGGGYAIGAGGTLLYDAGSGAHHGEIINIGAGTILSLNRGGQIQYGPSAQDALAQLTGNAGTLMLEGGSHSFSPLTGTFVNASGGTLDVTQSGTTAAIGGNFVNHGTVAVAIGGQLTVNQGFGFTNSSDGTLTVGGSGFNAGGVLQVGGNVVNHGNASVVNGTINASGALTSDGSLTLSSATLNAKGGVNAGTLSIQGGSTVTITGTFENAGGNITVGTPGSAMFSQTRMAAQTGAVTTITDRLIADQILLSGGELDIVSNGILDTGTFTQTGGTLRLTGGLILATTTNLQGGTVEGLGQFNGDLNNTIGTLALDSGQLFVAENYTQGANGALSDLLGSGSELVVGGDVTLSGMFDALLMPGMDLHPGDTFDIIHFDGTIQGDFTSFGLPSFDGLSFVETRDANNVYLQAVASQASSTPEPGTFVTIGFALLIGAGLMRRHGGARRL